MPRKTLILILVLATVTGILIFLAINSQTSRLPGTSEEPNVTLKPVEKTAKVIFNPQNVDMSAATTPTSVDILVDSGGADISGVQVELQYDPAALTNVLLEPAVDTTSYFGAGATVLFNEVKRETGRISYAVAISQGQASKAGVGKIATLSFSRATGAPTSTQVTFLDKTLVTVLGANESALKETVPLNITLSTSNSNQQFVPTTVVSPNTTQ